MKDKRILTTTEKMERSREQTKQMAARELLYAGVFARLWPSYLAEVRPVNDSYPVILCVESPAGRLTWRISSEELPYFEEWLKTTPNAGERAEDRTPVLMSLSEALK